MKHNITATKLNKIADCNRSAYVRKYPEACKHTQMKRFRYLGTPQQLAELATHAT